MSVRGEFLRLVGDAAARLRGGSPAAESLADGLERARSAASDDLGAAAEQVLSLWSEAPEVDLAPPDREHLDEVAERMLAVSRIILGR